MDCVAAKLAFVDRVKVAAAKGLPDQAIYELECEHLGLDPGNDVHLLKPAIQKICGEFRACQCHAASA